MFGGISAEKNWTPLDSFSVPLVSFSCTCHAPTEWRDYDQRPLDSRTRTTTRFDLKFFSRVVKK